MSIYAIGDIQGCYIELLELLNEINFDERNDQLWFAGDIINRGAMSLDCIEFAMSLGKNATTVLGNHDLHMLAVVAGMRPQHRKDTFEEIIKSEHADQIYSWLRRQHLMVHDKETGFAMVHAGLPPQWSLGQALELARETRAMINSDEFEDFLPEMYGNEPESWSDNLQDISRHRFVINAFTRMRYIDNNCAMNFSEKGAPGSQGETLIPWFSHPDRKTKDTKIIFGHWSTVTLGNFKNFDELNVYPLDTGCIWGGELTALRLEDQKLFSVPSRQVKS